MVHVLKKKFKVPRKKKIKVKPLCKIFEQPSPIGHFGDKFSQETPRNYIKLAWFKLNLHAGASNFIQPLLDQNQFLSEYTYNV